MRPLFSVERVLRSDPDRRVGGHRSMERQLHIHVIVRAGKSGKGGASIFNPVRSGLSHSLTVTASQLHSSTSSTPCGNNIRVPTSDVPMRCRRGLTGMQWAVPKCYTSSPSNRRYGAILSTSRGTFGASALPSTTKRLFCIWCTM